MVQHFDDAKNVGDIVSGALALGTLAQILPQVAAVLSIAWTVLRFIEWGRSKLKKKDIDPLDL